MAKPGMEVEKSGQKQSKVSIAVPALERLHNLSVFYMVPTVE
jgi:hypothetical protein